MRQSHTAVLARNEIWIGRFETEPYETAWATEAIFYVRALELPEQPPVPIEARVQISPDGMHWCDEGSTLQLPVSTDTPSFVRVRRFGGWLRLVGEIPQGLSLKIIAYLALKE